MGQDISAEDRLSLSDMFTSYCSALDSREPAQSIAAYYIPGGILDNSAVGSPVVSGQDALIQAFAGMLQGMDAMEHYLSNFLVLSNTGERAAASCFVQAYARPKGGDPFAIRGKYLIEAAQTGSGWKLARLTFQPSG